MERIASRTVKVKDGEIIIQEGTWPYYAYILKEGKARVLKNVGGKQVLIDLLTEGDIFGEISFLVKTKRTVSVIADGEAIVEMITRDTFMKFFEMLPLNTQNKLCEMTDDLTIIDEIFSRLVVLFQRIQESETKQIDDKAIEMETEAMPDFLRHTTAAIVRHHNASVEILNKLSSQPQEKRPRRMPHYVNRTFVTLHDNYPDSDVIIHQT